ncbi:MAG: NADPH-dependent glutamate synthase [bacterium]
MPIDKKEQIPRQAMRHQPPRMRSRNFDEVALGYTKDQAISEAKRCLQCKNAACVKGCPVAVQIPQFINLILEEKFLEAIQKIKETNSLPAVCGRVCPQEDQCEKKCILGIKSEPVAIGRLERFAADYELAQGKVAIPPRRSPTGKKIAVVGSGPSGLTLSGDLAKLGHQVTMFEALHKAGGVLSYGIPEFRLPKKIVGREVEFVRELGVELVTNFVVGLTLTVDEMLNEEGYDVVFLGNGAGLPYFMQIPGENLNGVYSANEFLTRANLMKAFRFPEYTTPIKKGNHVAVVGGGNVAMDSARTALRMGADKVSIVYRRSRHELPAREEEIENAIEEGINLELLTNPVEFIGDDKGWLKQVRCQRMELGEPDASGRRRPLPIEGSEFLLDINTAVIAIGQGANPLVASTTSGLETNRHGYVNAEEETGKTSNQRIFAGGDIVTGAATVILAMGAGKKAALAIHKQLTGEDLAAETVEARNDGN